MLKWTIEKFAWTIEKFRNKKVLQDIIQGIRR